MKLLIVDNDHHLVEMLTSWLKTLGYAIERAYSGEQARSKWREQQPDLVILDTTLKDVNALIMCEEMRREHDALVLALNEGRDVQDEVSCLENGADDFLRKPFFPAQLLAHIHAISRRRRQTLALRPDSIVTVGPLRIDASHKLATLYGKTACLTPTESKLLHFLAVNANHVCTPDQIVSHIWGFGNAGDSSLIKAHIRHIRLKIEPDPKNPRYICTVSGVGYTLVKHPVEMNLQDAV